MSIGELTSLAQSASGELKAAHERVAALTGTLFPGPVSIDRESDPEVNTEYFVVSAIAPADVAAAVALHHRWHVAIAEEAGELAHLYRLSFQMP